ncbi:hypothetical protein [Streptomyces sp. NPDC088739]|uniref:hypothetical protein n=1 Tax=Streptomyces sp. NPDC088739 TaxID=3365882 RepID=UPI003826D2B7
MHDRADRRTQHPQSRDDRTGTHARFTPLDDDNRQCGEPVDVVGRVRVTSRWIGRKGAPQGAVLVMITIDDVAQGRALAGYTRFKVETWQQDGAAPSEWRHGVDYAVVVNAVVITPRWVEVEGYSRLVDGLLGASNEGAPPPPFGR